MSCKQLMRRPVAVAAIVLSSTLVVAAQENPKTISSETMEVVEIAPNQHKVYTDIVIDAPPDEVWAVLTDFERMPDWSSTFQGLTGDFSNGGTVNALFLQQGNVTPFEHVLNLDEGVSFNWSDPFPFAPDMTDDHTFLVEAFGDGQTRFIQTDVFTGTGSEGLTTLGLATIVRDAYVSFNRELKNEVEK